MSLAEKYYNLYHVCYVTTNFYESSVVYRTDPFQPLNTTTLEELNDVKFWKAVSKSDWTTANKLLDHSIKQIDHAIEVEDKNIRNLNEKLYLPRFLCKALLEDNSKLQLLKELTSDQMDALLDFKRMDEVRESTINYYKSNTGCEEVMSKLSLEYAIAVEQMNLLKADIHPNFNIEVPALPDVKTKMQEIREYLHNNSDGFEAALDKLAIDQNRSLSTIFEVIYSVDAYKHRLYLMDEFKAMKLDLQSGSDNSAEHKFDKDFLEVFKNIEKADFEKFSTSMKKYLRDYSNCSSKDKVNFLKNNEKAFQSLGQFYRKQVSLNNNVSLARIYVAFADFWASVMSYLWADPSFSIERIVDLDPFEIEDLGHLGIAQFVPLSLQLIKAWSERPEATDVDTAEYLYALDYVRVFDAMKGVDMIKLWLGTEEQPKVYLLSVPLQVAKTLIENKRELLRLRGRPIHKDMPKKFIAFVNSPITKKLDDLRNAIEITDSNLKWRYTVQQALNSPVLKEENIEAFLRSRAIDELLSDLETVIYIDWKANEKALAVNMDFIKTQLSKFRNNRTQPEFDLLWKYIENYISFTKKELFQQVTEA